MKTTASLDLYRHTRELKFILVRHAPDKQVPGLTLPWGDLVFLPHEEIRLRGLETVLDDFREFPNRDAEGEVVWSNAVARRKAQGILRDYFAVSVGLLEQPILDVWSWHESARGHRVTLPEDHFQLALPCSAQRFYDTIMAAFDRCTVLT